MTIPFAPTSVLLIASGTSSPFQINLYQPMPLSDVLLILHEKEESLEFKETESISILFSKILNLKADIFNE